MTGKTKDLVFLPTRRRKKSHRTFGTTCPDLAGLPFSRHTSQRFAKAKEPNLAVSHNIILNDYKTTIFAK